MSEPRWTGENGSGGISFFGGCEKGQTVVETLVDQTLQEVVTLCAHVEVLRNSLEPETNLMNVFSLDKTNKENTQENPLMWISEDLFSNPVETSVRSQNLTYYIYHLYKTLTDLLYHLVRENSNCRDPFNLLFMNPCCVRKSLHLYLNIKSIIFFQVLYIPVSPY
jgi:hypothetical protein